MTRSWCSSPAALGLAFLSLSLLSCADRRSAAPTGGDGGQVTAGPVIGIDELVRLDLLPRLKRSVSVGLVSSYDRSGGNDDGFSGKYSFVRKEPGGLVLADLEGPGAVYRIHTPTPTDDVVAFYFDGEAAPRLRLKVVELFDGTRPPFLSPLADSGAGGYTSYVPLTYRRSLKIVLEAETFQFYDLNYATFPADLDLPSYEDPPSAEFLAKVEKAGALLRRAGADVSDALAPPGAALARKTVKAALAPGRSVTLFEGRAPGRIVGLRLGPAEALAGAGRDVVLRAYWDGAAEPAIDCPAGDLFGFSFGEPAARALLLGTGDDGRGYLHFPMPFERSARLELVSERDAAAAGGSPIEIEAEIVTAPVGKAADEGRFYARWRRENPCVPGEPYTFLRARGRGHVVGVALQAQGIETGGTLFFEGDDRVVIDGHAAVLGTGSEDSFNGGWYDVPGRWERRLSLPLSGCLDYRKPLARTGGYRLFLGDAYAFVESIDYTIEHGPEGNAVPTDYASVVYFYAQDPPAVERPEPLPPAAVRRVAGLDRIVFVPGWSVPIHTTSFQNAVWSKAVATVAKEAGAGEAGGAGGAGGAGAETVRVRHFSMRTTGPDIFGPHHVSFVCNLPEAGRYRVSVKGVLGPDQGLVRVFERDRPVGAAVSLYAPERALGRPAELGVFDLRQGDNILYLYLVGADPRAKAAVGTGMDLVEIIFERVK